jgi:hypothetical protein
LAKPTLTRWGSILQSLKTTLKSEQILFSLVSARDFIKVPRKQVQVRLAAMNLVRGNGFVDLLKKSISILEPIDTLIRKYQDDKVPISEVEPDFAAIATQYKTLFKKKLLSLTEYECLVALVQERKEFLTRRAHGLANMLDPRFLGESFSPPDRQILEDALLELSNDPPTEDTKEAIFREFTAFQISATTDKNEETYRYTTLHQVFICDRYSQLVKGNKTPREYWMTDGRVWPFLQGVAINLFHLVASSASCERNFSSMAFIHNKMRNKLGIPTVEKLVYVRTNQAIIDQGTGCAKKKK